jgi:hypothetical protein
VEVLGHPPRFIEDLPEVDWSQVFKWAAQTGTAIELNLNAFPRVESSHLQKRFWTGWLRDLAASKAWVFIGADLHNQFQLDEFVLQWQSLGHEASRHENHLARFLKAIHAAKLSPERVVTASYDSLSTWLQMDKATRARLRLKK